MDRVNDSQEKGRAVENSTPGCASGAPKYEPRITGGAATNKVSDMYFCSLNDCRLLAQSCNLVYTMSAGRLVRRGTCTSSAEAPTTAPRRAKYNLHNPNNRTTVRDSKGCPQGGLRSLMVPFDHTVLRVFTRGVAVSANSINQTTSVFSQGVKSTAHVIPQRNRGNGHYPTATRNIRSPCIGILCQQFRRAKPLFSRRRFYCRHTTRGVGGHPTTRRT